MKFASIMTDMDIHQTWTSSSAAEQELTGRAGSSGLPGLADLGSGSILGAYRRGAGRSGKLIAPAEASGLITDALRVQAMMIS